MGRRGLICSAESRLCDKAGYSLGPCLAFANREEDACCATDLLRQKGIRHDLEVDLAAVPLDPRLVDRSSRGGAGLG
jgi:hypothetical protein